MTIEKLSFVLLAAWLAAVLIHGLYRASKVTRSPEAGSLE